MSTVPLKPKTITRMSIVTPCYNEAEVLPEFVRRIAEALDPMELEYELVFVNDGSSDGTLEQLQTLSETRRDVVVVNLTRNFGKETALTAGLAHATGDAICVIDADLQDPPEVIPEFIAVYEQGYDNVYGRRSFRHGETAMKKATARAFYKIARNLGPVQLPENVGDFRLLSRRAVNALLQLPENHRFMKGLFAWIGYPSKAVEYERDPRFAGETKWNYGKLLNLSIEGITSFTTAPLRITSIFGVLIATASFFYAVIYLSRTLLVGEEVQGFPTLFLTILLLGGTQLVALGIIGEYLGRIFNESKRRPLYLVESVTASQELERDDTP